MSGDVREKIAKADMFDTAGWFFENGLDVFLVLRAELVERVNPAWTVLTGWSIEETIGQNMSVFGHPDNLSALAAATQQIETYGFAEADVRVRAKDGRWLWVSGRVRLNKDGLVMAALRDITQEREQKIKEDQARQASELLREVAGVLIWRFDPDRNLYFVDEHLNHHSVSVGHGHRTLSAQEMTEEVHPDDRPALWAAFTSVLNTGAVAVMEYRQRQGDGWTSFKCTMRGLRQSLSGKWEVMGLSQDVTQLANARDLAMAGERAAKEAADLKAQFLANMSHEIRTPLNGVLGVLHLLKTETLSTDGRGLLDEALNCGAMLAALLNDVLDFSKIEAGHLELQTEPVDIAAAIDGVAGILRGQVEAKGLSLTTEIEPGVGWVDTDPLRLRQVLFNLIGNAVKFTEKGGVRIRLSTTGPGANRRLRLEVIDSGIGIAAEAQAGLFTRFHQADASTTRRFGGTGLGLAITRTLTELMGGAVGVDSVAGEGSTFWIDLPGAQIAAPAVSAADEAGWLEGLRVLVVEDNATNRLIATKMLESLGARVETAENGALGVGAAQRAAFDLIFMDIQMPVMDGVAATAAIRALPAPVGQAPIIAMTANAMAHQLEQYRRAGMDGAVSKPLSPAAIIAEIGRLVQAEDAPAAATAA
jgi:PAS domain S-box-containing protein